MPERKLYTLADLEALTGVKKRTIRFWIDRGIVPGRVQKDLANRNGVYDDRHIEIINRLAASWTRNPTLSDHAQKIYTNLYD